MARRPMPRLCAKGISSIAKKKHALASWRNTRRPCFDEARHIGVQLATAPQLKAGLHHAYDPHREKSPAPREARTAVKAEIRELTGRYK